jgi:hypothetical protein
LCISHNFQHFISKLNFYQHFLSVYHFKLGEFNLLILGFIELIDGDGFDSAAGLDIGEVELKVGHPAYGTLVIYPIAIEFLIIYCWSLILQSLQKPFVLEFNVLELSLAVDLVETFVDFGADVLGFVDGICALLAHDAGYFL